MPKLLLPDFFTTIGQAESDIFVSAGGLKLTMCHESDVHIEATTDAANEILSRWQEKGYSPYVVLPPS